MRVLVSCSSRVDQGSGILAYSKNLVECYLNSGYEVAFVFESSENHEWCQREKLTIYETNSSEDDKTETQNLIKFIESYNPDVVINNDHCYLQALAPVIKVPFLFVLHLGATSILSLAKINQDYVDAYIATTSDMKFDFQKLGIKSHKIHVVLNGLNAPFYEKHQSNNEEMHILFSGENTRRKGADKFIKMINTNKFDNCVFHWTGGSKVKDKYEAQLNRNNKVVIYDRLAKKEFYELMYSCDVFLMPSRNEGLPIALLEAMGHGLVPIASNARGAMKEVICHSENGYLCDISKWESEAADLMHYLTINTKHLDSMKKQSLLMANQNYLNGMYASKILGVANSINKVDTLEEVECYYCWHRPSSSGVTNLIVRLSNSFKIRTGLILPYKGRR
ncbi:glycosyltransferase family 4 protein [Aliivibrio finisterrensis]|uniref:Glycosyltransferase n=1 Tax=Aliivibrio finisterrensis TaxID=511998 RepID=A0A4Q5KSR2_9GAMM|nr:glycosyltransferase [Aliivibrio finisterrensis]RYU48851.1 glycosyltransferase [Aliivibrio finisterrensis]RYU49447.1 glycosyltransferase [Aliivibrio finisterrensis]RYU57080.1 glycosyltransferase [Aliivibrio finisterrensis]RYU80164.1 glycosyltransferase [Aliivibrio finisterrensis]